MTTRRILLLTAALVLANVSFAATTSFAQSSQLNERSATLANEANDFAESSYRGYSGSFRDRDNRSSVQSAMLAAHFSGGARLFNRMVIDRVRRTELRDAFQVLESLATPIDANNVQPARWASIKRLVSDISQELSYDNPRNDDNQFPPSRSGRMTWKGRVDDDVRITIRGGRADLETLGGTPYYDPTTNFTASLPPRRVNVTVQVKKGRGQVVIEEQPSRENNYAAVIRVRDSKGGASDYEFDVLW